MSRYRSNSNDTDTDSEDGDRPVGTMRKLVSLVDRGAFDNIVYPQNERSTVWQPAFKPYHNYTTDVAVWPFSGGAEWGKRITFTVPQPWETDMISWMALRFKPDHWLTSTDYRHLYKTQDWSYIAPNEEWIWVENLGAVAIERAELEIDGVTVEQWSGDWINVWGKTAYDCNKGVGWDTDMMGPVGSTEDGYVYAYLPFWFAKWMNVSFPLISTQRPVRVHITLRPFHQVVRMRATNKTACDQTPLGSTFKVNDLSKTFTFTQNVSVPNKVPQFTAAELICGTALIDGELRKAYRDIPHELLMSPVVEMDFAEPLKYTLGVPQGDLITIGLPLTAANGPIRQILWFVRRKAARDLRGDWTNYSAVLEGTEDPDFNPPAPLLSRAQLLVGTAVWADQPEAWWRSSGALPLAGGIRAYGNYLYAYNFTEKPNAFDPAGSVNASRVDMRLNLEVRQPAGTDTEWEVKLFLVGTNWMRFENGLANQLFMD